MKAIANHAHSTIRITPVIALKHPAYRGPVSQAVAALSHLSKKYSLKNKRTGHA